MSENLIRDKFLTRSINKTTASGLFVSYLTGCLCLFCVLLSEYRISAIISLVSIVTYFVFLYINDSIFIWKYVYLVFGSACYIVGAFVCDLIPTYLSEMNVTTHYNGSFTLLSLYYWIFYSFLRVIDSVMSRRQGNHNQVVCYRVGKANVERKLMVGGGILIFVLGIAMLTPILNNPAFINGMGRFSYATYNMPHLLNRIAYYPIYLSPIIVGYYIQKYQRVVFKGLLQSVLYYLPYILFLIWAGHKFGSFWTLIYCFAIPLVFCYGSNRISKKAILFSIILVIGLFFLLIVFYMMRGLSFSQALNNLAWRTSAQGELWWSIYEYDAGGPIRLEAFGEELSAIWRSLISRGEIREYGVYRLMEMFGEPKTMSNYIGTGSRLSAGGFELAFYHFKGLFMLICPLIYAPLFSFITNKYLYAIVNGTVAKGVLYFIVLQAFHGAVLQGDWINFIALDTLFCVCILLLLEMCERRYMLQTRQCKTCKRDLSI